MSWVSTVQWTSDYISPLGSHLSFCTVDDKGGVKISDFGISKKVEEGKSLFQLMKHEYELQLT